MRKNTGKRLSAGILGTVLVMGASMPVQAAGMPAVTAYTTENIGTISVVTDNTVTVEMAGATENPLQDNLIEFNEVEMMVISFNDTVLSNRYTYRNLQDMQDGTDDDDDDGESSPSGDYDDDAADEAIEAIEDGIDVYETQIKALKTQMNATTDPTAKAALQTQITLLENTKATLVMQQQSMLALQGLNSSMSDMADSMSSMASGITDEDLRGYYLQFEEIEATLIKTAQGMFPTYYQLVYNLEQLKANLRVAETSYQGAQVRQTLGMCTANEVLEASYNVTNIKNNIANLENQIVTIKQELCKLIGKDYNADITLGELPGVYEAYVANIVFEHDVDAAVDSNYTVCSKQNEIRKYDSDTSEETRAAGKYALAAAREESRSALSQAYMNIQTQRTALQMALEKWRNAETQMLNTEGSYKLGLISRLEYEQQLASYLTTQYDYKIAETKLFDAVNTYKWHLRGL